MTEPQREERDAAAVEASEPEAHEPDAAEAPTPLELPVMSAQALRLHVLGCALTDARSSGGVIGRTEAELLAERTGSLVSEVVESGLWIETDLAYVIRSRAGS